MSTSTIDRRRWLCIAYAFPPTNRSGTHRTAAFVQHLHTLGWDATVLTVHPDGESRDDGLLQGIPSSTRVVRTGWIDPVLWLKRLACPAWDCLTQGQVPAELDGPGGGEFHTPDSGQRGITQQLIAVVTSLLQTPDSRIGWWPAAVRAGLREIRGRHTEAIYSTSPYATAHLVALALHVHSGIPWVADFRDPWRGNPFRVRRPDPVERIDTWLESLVVRHASWIVCNTPTATADFCRRYPRTSRKCSTILNGIDQELTTRMKPVRPIEGNKFLFTHCGQFYGQRRPHPWFAALAELRRREPHLAGQIRFCSVGGADYEQTPLSAIAQAHGVEDLFVPIGPVAHHRALQFMAGSDALVLAGSAGPGADLQVPNKLFEYLGLRRPIVAAVAAKNPSAAILTEARAEFELCRPGDSADIAAALKRMVTGKSMCREAGSWSGVSAFHREAQSEKLRRILERLAPASRTPLASASTLADSTNSHSETCVCIAH